MKVTIFRFIFSTLLLIQIAVAEENNKKEEILPALKIGAVLGLTGPASTWSNASRMGLEIARDEINSEAGIDKPKVELIFEDSQSNPTAAVNSFRKLVSLNKVNAIVGDVWGYLTNAMVPVAESTKTVLASPVVFKESIEKTNPYFFSMGEKASSISKALDEFYKSHPEIKKIGIFCWDDLWGQAYLTEWINAAKRNNIEIAEQSCILDFNFDFKITVTKMKLKKVDAVFITYKTSVILQRLKEQKFSPVVFATSDLVEDLISRSHSKELFENTYIADWHADDDFKNKVISTYKTEPINQAHDSYYLLKALYAAYLKRSPELKDGLKLVKFDTNLGTVDFSKDNFGNFGEAALYQVKNGLFIPQTK